MIWPGELSEVVGSARRKITPFVLSLKPCGNPKQTTTGSLSSDDQDAITVIDL
jgi:hypothetical protein